MTIRAIFYDLDGTLRMNVPSGWHTFSDFASELGLITSQDDRLRAGRWIHYYFAESPELQNDRVSFPDNNAFWYNFGYRQLTVLGASPGQAADIAPKIHQRMIEDYRPADLIPDDLVETLKILKERGYILGVLSNRNDSFESYLAELGLREFFDVVIPAGEAGVYKPNPDVFHFMLEKANVTAEESIYVGDNYYADIVGARKAGMSAVLLDIYGLFPEPDCPVIESHTEILALLERS
ncbi:MAG TPA: HAD family hydrolase [Anaerolineales bacterium]|jgi:putative hydrolase of the HAD superfamily